MATFFLFISSYTIIQGDVHHIDRSQTTTNTDSYNNTTSLATGSQSSAPDSKSPLGSTPNDISTGSPSANTTSMPHQQSGETSAARRTSTSSSMSVEDVYPISRVFTQDQRTTSRPTDSLEAPESLSARIRNSPAQKKLRQRVFNKLKGWFNRFFNYLS